MYSGIPFTSFVKERIFNPLGMTSTTYSPEEAAQSGNFSQPFTLYEGNIRRIPFSVENDTVEQLIAGPGGIISTTVDIVSPLSSDFNNWVPRNSHIYLLFTSMPYQLKWLGMLLNEGVDPVTGKTIIPQSAFNVTTSAQSIVTRVSSGPGTSIAGYGVGWITASFYGHDVRLDTHFPTFHIECHITVVYHRFFNTTEASKVSCPSSLSFPLMESASSAL